MNDSTIEILAIYTFEELHIPRRAWSQTHVALAMLISQSIVSKDTRDIDVVVLVRIQFLRVDARQRDADEDRRHDDAD